MKQIQIVYPIFNSVIMLDRQREIYDIRMEKKFQRHVIHSYPKIILCKRQSL